MQLLSHRLKENQAGFTAVELLITLFIAGIFIVAGYQLFNVIIRDGADARAESRTSNISYAYMRKYSNSATNPCTPQTPLSNSTVTENVDGLLNPKMSIVISCPLNDAPTVSKIEAVMTYGDPQQTSRFSTFLDNSKGATPNPSVTNGLIGWWRLNGNGNSELNPSANATGTAVTSAAGQNGQPNNAMNFTDLTSQLAGPSGDELASVPISFSLWVNPRSWPVANASAFITKRGATSGSDGYMFGYLTTSSQVYADCGGSGAASRWRTGYTPPFNTWTHLVLVCAPSSVTLYVNGTQQGTRASNDMTNTLLPSSAKVTLGNDSLAANNYGLDGLLDDVRVYNRVLSGSEAAQLFSQGAK